MQTCIFFLIALLSGATEPQFGGRLITDDDGAYFETQINRLDVNRDGEAELVRIGVKVYASRHSTDLIYQGEIPSGYGVLNVVTSQGAVLDGDAAYPVQVNLGNLSEENVAWINYDLEVASRAGRFFNTIACQGLVESGNHPQLLTDDPDTAVFADPTVTALGSEPAVKALKTDTLVIDANGNGLANPGDVLSYKTEIGNVGTSDGENVVYRVPMNMTENVSLVSGSVATTQGVVVEGNDPGDTEIRIDLGTVAPDGGAVVTFRAEIHGNLPVGATHAICQGLVEGNFLPTKTDDPETTVLGDPTRTLLEEEPRLIATKTDSLVGDGNGNGMADPGDRIRFVTTVQNGGTSEAQGTNFKLEGARNLDLVAGSVITSQGVVETGNQPGDTGVTVEMGNIPANGIVEIVFETTVVDPLPIGAVDGECQGRVSGSNLGSILTDDPETPLVGDPTLVPFGRAPGVWVRKQDILIGDVDGDGEADPGDTLEYRITLGNSGNETGRGVSYGSPGGSHAALITGSVTTTVGVVASGNQSGDTDVAVTLGTVSPGDEIIMTFRVLIDSPLPPEVTTLSCQGLATGDNLSPTPSDDPDTGAPGDPTVTPLDRNPVLLAEKTDHLVVDHNGNGQVNFGDVVRYTTVIENQGSGDAIGVRFESGVDPNTDLNIGSVTTTDGTVISGNQNGDTGVEVDLGLIEVGETITIEFDVTVKNPANSTSASCQGVLIGVDVYVLTDDPDTPEKGDPTETEIEREFDAWVQAEMTSSFLDQDGDGRLSVGDLLNYQVNLQPGGEPRNATYHNRPDLHTRLIEASLSTSQGEGEVVDGEILIHLGDLTQMASIYYDVEVLGSVGRRVVNQGRVTGSNFAVTLTDDPRTPEPNDPTVDHLGDEAVPALSTVGLVAFTGGLLGLGVWKSRTAA